VSICPRDNKPCPGLLPCDADDRRDCRESKPMTPADDWAELEALAKAATPGKWRAWFTRRRSPEIYTDPCGAMNDRIGSTLRKNDAAFIAAANPATILKLIARQQEGGWQPIETAPRDGTWVIGATDFGVVPLRWGLSWNDQHWANGCVVYRPTHWRPLPPSPDPAASSEEM
jgi:hypothetical protein